MAKKNKRQRQRARSQAAGGGSHLARQEPPDARVIAQAAVQEITQSFSGPLPPPEVLRHYEDEFPGLAERIIRSFERPLEMAQAQQEHRIELEKKVIVGDSRRSWTGLILGFVVAMTTILGGCYLIMNDKSLAGFGAIVTALGSLVGAFVYSERRRTRDLEQKRQS